MSGTAVSALTFYRHTLRRCRVGMQPQAYEYYRQMIRSHMESFRSEEDPVRIAEMQKRGSEDVTWLISQYGRGKVRADEIIADLDK